MWITGFWVPISRELLYGIGFLLFLLVIVAVVVIVKRKRNKGDSFSSSRVFKGKNLERAGRRTVKEIDLNYEDMPVVDLKWQQGNPGAMGVEQEDNYDDDDDDEDKIDDGYTVVEKTIQEKAKQLPFVPPQKQSTKSSSSAKESKKEVKPAAKKDATGDKMDFFTTGKSAL